MEKTTADTSALNILKDVLVAVNGQVKSITKDEKSATIELGDTTSMSSITCQFDNRHLADLTSVKEGSQISVKGNITGFSIDTELGLGNTIEMKSCTLNK
jgi:aspartyl/asparaginyl-tRNA synthetase